MNVRERSPDNVYDIVTGVLGIEGTQRGEEYDFCCPVHPDRHPSAGVNLTTGAWHCLACGAGGNLVSLVMAVKGVDPKTALRLVKPHTPPALLAALYRAVQRCLGATQRRSGGSTLPTYPPEPMDYLIGRGYTRQTLREYGVGHVAQERFDYRGRSVSIRDYVALPIRDHTGLLLAWCYRACHPTGLRYLYTPGVRIADLWFGLNLHYRAEHVVVTEGALDSMWVHQAGFPAIALLGANMRNQGKLKILSQHRSITLFLDRDTAGAQAVRALGEAIHPRTLVKVARYPRRSEAKDPADLTPGQVARAIDQALPFDVWRS